MAPKSLLALDTTRAGSWIRMDATKCFSRNERRAPGAASPSAATSLRAFPRETGLKPRVLGSLGASGNARNPGEFVGFLLRELIPCSGCRAVGCRRLSPRTGPVDTHAATSLFWGGEKQKLRLGSSPFGERAATTGRRWEKADGRPRPAKMRTQKNPVCRRGQPCVTPHPSHPAPGTQSPQLGHAPGAPPSTRRTRQSGDFGDDRAVSSSGRSEEQGMRPIGRGTAQCVLCGRPKEP